MFANIMRSSSFNTFETNKRKRDSPDFVLITSTVSPPMTSTHMASFQKPSALPRLYLYLTTQSGVLAAKKFVTKKVNRFEI
ncbi:hypothetical protein B5X24_HaOG202974 [Helicoverpa armigera]|uniref:Uncharacterized protein n=1 Tax=Helicoverpa armigera TaxID=29058 RepID=A0A2W1BVZ8_HELAM|nr:hypothetical protein B5X24_HaOG202974 [Helicoverpa armigera]